MGYLDLARSRYSCREFEDRSVEQAVVDAIVEAGRIAPSACNNHPTRVMVLDTPELLEKATACQPRLLVMDLSLGLRLSSLFAALPMMLGYARMIR